MTTDPLKRADSPRTVPKKPLAGPAFPLRAILEGFRANLPVAIGVTAYGIAMGIVAAQRGLSFAEMYLMDVTVLAGSAEITAVGLWGDPIPTSTIVFSTFVINLRYVLLCASLRDIFAGRPLWQKLLGIHLVADENWAVTMDRVRRFGRPVPPGFLLGGGLAILVAWWVGSGAGYVLGGQLPDPKQFGLDFAFAAAFIALTRGFWRSRRADLLPWAGAAVVALVTWAVIGGNWYIVTGSIVGAVLGAVRPDGDQDQERSDDVPR